MIQVVKFDHISMAVPDLDKQIDILERLFGFRLMNRFSEPGYHAANIAVPGTSRIGWEVLTPDGPDSYLHRFIGGTSGPGLHHVALQIESAAQAAEVLREQGIEPWGYGPPAADDDGDAEEEQPARSVVYIHPRSGGHGFLYQLYAGRPWNDYPAFDDDGEHTLGIVAVNHLAHAHPDRDELGDWYERIFGMRTIHRSREPSSEAPGASVGFVTRVLESDVHPLRIEVIQPWGEGSFVQRFIDQRGPSMHHVTFEVGDWQRAIDACAYHEVPIFGEREGSTDGVTWREAFIHPRHTGGMLVQFFWQAEPGVWI